jgi:hypothetical protein
MKRPTGRPPTGNTTQVWGRVSDEASDLIISRAETLGIPKARVVGAMLEFAMAHEDQIVYPQSPASRSQQEELPLHKAS